MPEVVRRNLLARRVQQLRLDRARTGLLTIVVYIQFHLEHAVGVIVDQIDLRPEIAYVQRPGGPQEDIAENTTEPPEILVLQIAAVAVPIHLRRQHIIAVGEILGDIEYRRCATALTVADFLTIDPEIERRIHPVELDQHLSAVPVGRYLERPAIRTHRIPRVVVGEVLRRLAHDIRRVLFERILDIRVNRRSVAVHLPVARNRYFIPLRGVEILLIELRRSFCRLRRPVEFPLSVERFAPRRSCPVALQRRLAIRERLARRPRRLLVDTYNLLVLPVGSLTHRGDCQSQHRGQCNYAYLPETSFHRSILSLFGAVDYPKNRSNHRENPCFHRKTTPPIISSGPL